jgi:FixJ family two-component response regulator
VDEAIDGEVGLRLVERGPPYTLIVTDLEMPRLDGRSVAQTLAHCRPTQAVLYTSGHPDAWVPIGPPDAEYPFLAKPFNPSQLYEAVQVAIDRAAALDLRARSMVLRGRRTIGEAERLRAEAVATWVATRDLVAYARGLRGP